MVPLRFHPHKWVSTGDPKRVNVCAICGQTQKGIGHLILDALQRLDGFREHK